MKIDRRDLRKPAGLERSDKPDTQTSDKIKKGIVKRLSNMFMESRFTISFYKKAVKNAKAKKKLPNESPFWRERVKAANFVRCRQKWECNMVNKLPLQAF